MALADCHQYCSVSFRHCISTEFQEYVKVVGSCTELGNWDVNAGVDLSTQDNIYPCWITSHPVLLPLRQKLAYKYVIMGLDGSFHRWEDFEGNRSVIPTGPTMTVEDDDGYCRSRLSDASPEGSLPGRPTTRLNSRSAAGGVLPERATDIDDDDDDILPSPSDEDLHENTTLVIAAFELPLRVIRTPKGFVIEKRKSLVMPQLHALRHAMRVAVKFIGWPGIIVESESEQREIEELLEAHDCIPVFMHEEQSEMFRDFCDQCLWPLFHNVVSLESGSREQPFSAHGWVCYQTVNRLYADAVAREVYETDLIWIHDFQLLLVPQFITRRIRKANVGLFLHIPFPSSEIFRCLPVREEILRGMLCADLIGFHFFEYARHFLVVNKRLLGLDHHFRMGGFLELDYGGRSVMIRVGHVHVQYEELRRSINASEEVLEMTNCMRNQFEGKFIFASIDRCEPLSGILLKLRGFQHFLRNYSYSRSRAVLIQYAYPTSRATKSHKDYCKDYCKDLEALVDEINEEFKIECDSSGCSISIKSISPEKKYALFQAADCFLDTSIRDGLNLVHEILGRQQTEILKRLNVSINVSQLLEFSSSSIYQNPFEYICCRKDDPAPLILSEFTGCCRTLASAIRVNPWKWEDVSQALDRAMNTPSEEIADRFLRDQMYLQRNSTLQWADEFLLDLRRARKKDDLVYVSWGFGTSYRVCGLDSNFQYLNCELVVQSFRIANRRVLFFDHEGTLAPDRRRITAVPGLEMLTATGSAPGAGVRKCLASLCAAGHVVVILSGRDRNLLEDWFGVPQLGGAENWQCLLSKPNDFTWKAIAIELMTQYVKRTQGAFIENKGSALVFQFRDADPDFGSWQAKELSNYLEELLFGCPVTVMSGKGYVEVKLRGVNKGHAVLTVLQKLSQQLDTAPVDFVLCIGDDRSDEDMFPVVNSLFDPPKQSATSTEGVTRTHKRDAPILSMLSGESEGEKGMLGRTSGDISSRSSLRRNAASVNLPVSFSVTVGKKPSHARYYLNDVEDVSDLLELLA